MLPYCRIKKIQRLPEISSVCVNGPSGAYSVVLLSDATFRRFTRLRCGWVGHYASSAGAKRERIASDVTSDPVVRRPVALLCAELGQWVTYIYLVAVTATRMRCATRSRLCFCTGSRRLRATSPAHGWVRSLRLCPLAML